ncbi:phosphoserine phosphatase SerB [Poseidonocella sedimentorum]|uniref:Phosphoserine phosphatase n=1 Tax=Poseidonocella sedimentorum TaxID=871652 RepID=A0A1I6CQ65_9RHOB|nr:phosphoserine phosphatase SerB [Poseidonocella sedimentorum]SFQ95346.1 phosphoserine phosphatase [Poseidonocella sedimentorum]
MHVVSLIAPRGKLERAPVEALRDAWGGGTIDWLAPGEAAEFALEAVPANAEAVRDELGALGIDLAVQPAAGRRKAMLLADMDSTIIEQECIDELAEVAGVGAQVREITARAMNGELDFEGALLERVALLEGLPVTVIEQVWRERITLAPGAEALLGTMRANGARCVLVSGGFTAFTDRVRAAVGFHEARANTLLAEGDVLTGRVGLPILGREAKVAALEEITLGLGITPAEVLAVGDGANDLGMLARAGAGVALHAKPTVAAQAGIRIDHGDLTALLYLQGYRREEFVTLS